MRVLGGGTKVIEEEGRGKGERWMDPRLGSGVGCFADVGFVARCMIAWHRVLPLIA